MTSSTAYIDMEFAGIYGTRQSMQIPVEIGIVIHHPEKDMLSFTGRAFSFDIDVELWKNVMNDVGKRIDGRRRVFNLARPEHSCQFDPKFHLGAEGRSEARRAITVVHKDLREFMKALNREDISTLVFFARRREVETLKNSRVNTEGFLIRDLQGEIKTQYRLKEHVSLDRVSLVTGFRITKSTVGSVHFSYSIPEQFRYLIKPHKAIGDAARMFLVDQEFHQYPEEFGERLNYHIALYEQRKQAESSARDEENGLIRPQTM
jgi:hypothetical protein